MSKTHKKTTNLLKGGELPYDVNGCCEDKKHLEKNPRLIAFTRMRRKLVSQEAVEQEIGRIEKENRDLIEGTYSTIQVNAPRAMAQLAVVSKLEALYWTLGKKYRSHLKGYNG